jgi:hypothetical protein
MKVLRKIFIEMIPVILGVLIALFINNWKQTLDDQKFLKKIYSSVEREMELNLNEFSTLLPIQYALIDSLNYWKSNKEVSLIEALQKTNGLQIPTVKNTAWNSFLNSKLELIDFEVVSILTDVEEKKEVMNIKTEKLMDFVLNNTDSSDSRDKKILIIHLLNLINSEKGLVETYEEYLGWRKKETSH